MDIKFLDCWVFGGPAIIAFGFSKQKGPILKPPTQSSSYIISKLHYLLSFVIFSFFREMSKNVKIGRMLDIFFGEAQSESKIHATFLTFSKNFK
jgi:hypothetical protein